MSEVQLNDLLVDFEDKMCSSIAQYYYKMADVSVKVNPNSFLSTVVKIDGMKYNLEDLVNVYKGDEYTVSIVPKDPKYMISVIKGLKLSHPEYKLEESTYQDPQSGQDVVFMLCSMPEVNDDRYKVCTDLVDTSHDAEVAKLKKLSADVKVNAAEELSGASAELVKRTDDEIKKIEDHCFKSCDKIYNDKMKEITDGHEKYLAEAASEQQQQSEMTQSREASLKMDM